MPRWGGHRPWRPRPPQRPRGHQDPRGRCRASSRPASGRAAGRRQRMGWQGSQESRGPPRHPKPCICRRATPASSFLPCLEANPPPLRATEEGAVLSTRAAATPPLRRGRRPGPWRRRRRQPRPKVWPLLRQRPEREPRAKGARPPRGQRASRALRDRRPLRPA